MQPIRLGIAGIGRAGYGMQCQEIKGKKDQWAVAAACDILAERRQKMADEYGCATYERLEDMLQDDQVELVSIATRSADHFRHAMMALEAGKAVLIEKPMCVNAEQAAAIRDKARQPGSPPVFIRHNRRFEAHFMAIQSIMAEGLLGDVFEIHITRNGYSRRDDWQTLQAFGGGILLNWGPHLVDQALRFLGSPVQQLTSDLKHTVAAGDCEDHITVTLTGSNGRTVCLQVSGGIALPTPEYRVCGTRGALQVMDGSIHVRYIDPGQILPPLQANPETPGQTFGRTGTFETAEPLRWIDRTIDIPAEDLTVIWDHLYNSIRLGKPFPITLDEAVGVIEVISQARAASPMWSI